MMPGLEMLAVALAGRFAGLEPRYDKLLYTIHVPYHL
jgi:hypothetical protein